MEGRAKLLHIQLELKHANINGEIVVANNLRPNYELFLGCCKN